MIIDMRGSKRIRWAVNVARIVERNGIYMVLVRRPEG
jgi:hypothetical protein